MPYVPHFSALGRVLRCASVVALLGLAVTAGPWAEAQSAEVPAAAAPTGTVAGRFFSFSSGEWEADVLVEVEGTEIRTLTDGDGRYRLENVPAGSRVVLVRKAGFEPQRLAVDVLPEETSDVSGQLQTATQAPSEFGDVLRLDELQITAAPTVLGGDIERLQIRRQEQSLVDGFGTEQFARLVGSSIADVFQKATGTSVARGQFAVVRGLNERYNPVMLAGLILPTPDPYRQYVQLDLFPTRFLEGVDIYKSFVPKLPGAATGSAIDVKPKTIVQDNYTEINFGVSFDEGVLKGDEYLTYPTGGNKDYFALGADDRQGIYRFGTGQASPLTLKTTDLLPGGRFSFAHGRRFSFGEDRRLSYNLAGTYNLSYSTDEVDYTFWAGTGPTNLTDGTFRASNREDRLESEETASLAALLSVGFSFNDRHSLNVLGLVSQVGEDFTRRSVQRIGQAGEAQSGGPIVATDFGDIPTIDLLEYRQRNLTSILGSGSHALFETSNGKLTWSLGRSTANQQTPETRETFYYEVNNPNIPDINPVFGGNGIVPTSRPLFAAQSGGTGGETTPYSLFGDEIDEEQIDFRADYSQRLIQEPFPIELASGYYDQQTDRRAFTAVTEGQVDATAIVARAFPFDFYPSRDALRYVSPAGRFNRMAGDRQIKAGYLSLSVKPLESLRLEGGVRAERTTFSVAGRGLLFANETLDILAVAPSVFSGVILPPVPTNVFRSDPTLNVSGRLGQTDWLPAASLVFTPFEGFDIRAAFSRTIARPSLWELSPYFSFNNEDGIYFHGNPGLQLSKSDNWDLRLEYYFPGSQAELMALGFFHKRVVGPIERVALPFPDQFVDSFINNPNPAVIRGVEFEFRKSLGFLAEALENLTVGGNFSVIDAKVDVLASEVQGKNYRVVRQPDGSVVLLGTPTTRGLYDQAEWLANAEVSYARKDWGSDFTLSFFASGDSLRTVVLNRDLPNLYDRAYHRVDFAFNQKLGSSWKLRFTARNLTDPLRKIVYGADRYGDSFTQRAYKDGRSYSLTTTYEF